MGVGWLAGVLAALLPTLGAGALVAQTELQVCQQAVERLLASAGRLELRDDSRALGFGGKSISWRAPDSSSGVCRVDGAGRVYAVEVENFGYGQTGSGSDWTPYSLTCESSDGRRRECPVRDRSRVRLERQLSRAECREGSTWGYYRDRLWVDDGCRGVFNVAPIGTGSGPVWNDEQLGGTVVAACQNKAARQGMEILSTGRPRRVDAQRWEVEMRVALRGLRFEAGCSYNTRTGYVEVFGK